MADLSKLELTDSTLVTIKDNSQANSDHRHYEKDIVPLLHKTYESTSYYATATSWEASSWFFASVIPDSWYLPWKIKFRMHSYCPYNSTYESITEAMLTGRSNGMSYANWNETQTAAHYYTIWYPLKKAGFDAGYGHAIGVSIYGASNYTNASYYRTFEIDLIECENCTITFLDTPVLWSNWSGTGSTYYESRATGNAYSRGLQETGDTDTAVHNRITYFAGTTGNKGIWANSLFMEDAFGNYQDICTAADGTVTANSRTTATTKKANTNGFKVSGSIWYINTTYNADTQISGSSVVYSAYGLCDARYSFNVILSTTSLIPYKEIYLCGTIGDDGLFYLDQNQWWTQTPTDGSKIYVLIGAVYDSTASNVRFTLYEQNKWYRYDGTNLIEIANEAVSATSLAGTPRVLNQEPYLFRSTPNGVGNFELDSIVGGTVAFNQMIEPKAASSGTSATVQYTHDGNGNLTLSGTPTSGITLLITSTYPTYINGHKYFIKGCPKGGANTTYSLRYNSNGYGEIGTGAIVSAVTGSASNRQIKVGTNYPVAFIAQGQATNFTYTPIVIDLTQMFGSTIADYINTLETTIAGAGVAYFCKLFPKTYYPYTAGELISVKTSKHITKGFNQFDKTTSSDWQNWYINASVITAHTYCKSAVIPCIPNTTYYAKHEFGARLVVGSFPNYPQVGDVSTNPAVSMGTGDVIYTTGACDKYLVVWFYNSQVDTDYSAQDVADVLVVNISSYRNGEYGPYIKHEYDLDDDLELQGLPLLGADNKLYYDGDTYSSDGTVNRKYFKYTVTGAETLYVANTSYIKSDACDAFFNLNTIEPIVNTALPDTYCKSNVLEMRTPSSGIWSSTGFPNCGALNNGSDTVQVHMNIANNLLGITDYTQETTTTVKTKIATYLSSLYQANKPIEFIFKLKTGTTETADTFTNPQEVDQYGTEEYVDTRTVSMPVGHSTIYYSYDDRSKLDSLPDPASADGTYAISQTNGKQTLVPTSSISVGDAETVNGHTVEANVPSDAVFTDTTYTFAGGTNKITVTPSGGSASDINITVDDTTKLPLAGGTLTGDVFATRGTASQRKLGFINDDDKFGGLKLNNSGNNIDFGWDYDQVAGAGAYFRAATYGSGTGPGQFGFFARSSSGTKQLVGSTDGTLTWNGRRVVTSTNSTQIGSATKPVYVNNTGNVTECTNTLEASVPSNAVFTDANVTQSVTSTNANYEVLFSGTADNTTRTEGARKNSNLTFNPNNGELTAVRFTGLTKEEYLEWGGRNIASNVSPVGAALSADHSANRFNYLNPAAMTFEYSSDGGTTWTNYALTDGAKTAFVTDSMSYRINIGRPDDTTDVTTQSRSRITFTCQNGTTGYVYTNPKKLLINVSTAKPLSVLIETRTGTNYLNDGAWVTFGTYTLSGQSGWNDIPLILGTLGGGTGQTGNNWQLRLTISVPEVSVSYPKTADIRGIRLFGENTWYMANNLAKTGHVYAIDTVQNATFPANVQIKANKQVAYLSTTPTSGQVVVTDGASGGIKTTGYTIAKSVPSDAVFTDTMVTQTLTSTDANYPILFAKTTISTTTVDNINTARRNNSIYVNPSTGNLQVTQLNGVTVGDSPVFTDAKVTQNPLADNIKPLLLANSVSSSATTGQVYKQTNFTVDGYTNSLNLNAVSDAPAELNIQGNINIDAVDGLSVLYAPDTTATFSDVSAETINGEAIGTVISKDVPVSGNASTTQVVMGDDTRLTDTRTPKSHTHGNIANGGTISSTAVTPASSDYILISDTSNSSKIERGIELGSDTTKYLRNDGTWEAPSGGSVGQIYYCETDSTSTTAAFVVNATGVTALTDGLILCIKNTTGTSASGCTLNLNGLGAKGIWLSEANSACTTEWKNNTTYLFVYDATNERWVMQTGRDTDVIGNNIVARYSRLPAGGNGVKKYSLFAMLPDGTFSSFTTNSGTGAKTFDSTNYFDIRNIFALTTSSDRASGAALSASSWEFQGYDVDMRYSFTGVTTNTSTSSLTTDGLVYLVFNPSAESGSCYKLKFPYYTQTPTSTGCIYVLLGVMRDSYRLDLWGYNPAFTYDGTKLVPFANATFAGLTDTYISNPAPCDVLMFDGSDWVNTNNIVLKDTNLHTTVSLDGDTGKITCAEMSVAEPIYTITKTSGAWNTFTDNPITTLRTGNVVHLQINLEGSGSSVSAGNDGFTGTLSGGSLPALPVKFIDYYGNNLLIMYIQPNGQVKVRLIGSNLTVPSDNILNFSGTFIVN